MNIASNQQLICPVRGLLNTTKMSKDGLTPTEESYRIEAINYLISVGYPKENFWIEPILAEFGNDGRNSFRSDFAVLDVDARLMPSHKPDDILNHALIICEVKRDNRKSEYVKDTQVKPMLNFAKLLTTVGLYWDNIEKRVFWIEIEDNKKEIKEGGLHNLPKFGMPVKTAPLTFNTIQPTKSLLDDFAKIETILHQASFTPEKRYETILKLLLAKIFDEHQCEAAQDEVLVFQDYEEIGVTPDIAKKKITDLVNRAVRYYEKHLPNKVSEGLDVSDETLRQILKVLAPLKIIESKRDVVQTFYMKFAKDMYKWDMAQYFTPTTVTDFIVDLINPQFDEHVADPACGSADFLVAAFRYAKKYNSKYAECVWGYDNSSNAVQVAVLNMLLNGDGKSQIVLKDSLESVNEFKGKYDIITCNPPFGTRIVEKRKNVLCLYDLGYEWTKQTDGTFTKTDNLVDAQETGILFIETCVKECRAGGRIAIILPNGYLGNRSDKYKLVREWILRHTRIAAIISLPRFTFKTSGADVSASVLYLEKRDKPIERLADDSYYRCAVELIEKVGWDAGNKKAAPIYKRNELDGSLILDGDGNPIIDCDFNEAISRIVNSDAATCFEWSARRKKRTGNPDSWTIGSDLIYNDPDLTLDPKRYGRKVMALREALTKGEHLKLGDIVNFIAEKQTASGKKVTVSKSAIYNYVEIQDIVRGDYSVKQLRGWELPSRAKHFCEPHDIYFGSIWGSTTKWCYIPENAKDVVVTNGCFRCRIKPGKEQYLTDLLAYMNSEGWAVQLRSFARGSDGLAEICEADARNVIIPVLCEEAREKLQTYVANLKSGSTTINSVVRQMIGSSEVEYFDPKKRPSHIVLV